MRTGSVPNQHVAAFVDRHRALGVLAEGEAGHAQRGGLFLQAAAVGHDQRRVLPQVEELHVGLRAWSAPRSGRDRAEPRLPRVRGCTGKISGSSAAISAMPPRCRAGWLVVHVGLGRCSVTTPYFGNCCA
jgi:hypothetical protein